jgi:hypothetical protein
MSSPDYGIYPRRNHPMRSWLPRRLAAVTALSVVAMTIYAGFAPPAAAAPASKIVFITSAQTLTAGTTGGTITVQLQGANSQPASPPPSTATVVTLTTSSSGGTFRNTTDTATITNVTIPAGQTNGSFRYRDTAAGSPTLTASKSGLTSGTQSETVGAAALDHITISPTTATVGVGASQTYATTAFDVFNNNRGVVTGSTSFTITPNGSCSGPTCSASVTGAHTVTATFSAKTATATLTVSSSAPSKIVFTSSVQTLTAGTTGGTMTVQLQTSTGAAANALSTTTINLTTSSSGGIFRNTTDTSTITSVSINAGSNTVSFRYRDTVAGSPTLTATATGLASGNQTETVNAAALDHITISPTSATIVSGGSQAYTTTAFDVFNNSRGVVTPSTTFTISPNGSCTAATCTATSTGSHTVTGNFSGKTATSSLTVTAPVTPTKLAFTTSAQTLVAGITSNTITVQLQSSTGAPATKSTATTVTLTTTSPAGSFRDTGDTTTITSIVIPANTSSASFKYRDTHAGTPTITTATSGLTSATQNETVNAGALDHIAIAPKTATILAGTSQPYTVTGFDAFNNSRGTIASPTLSITPNGSCTSASCTASITGAHTVTATSGGKTDTASLTVNAAALDHIVITPDPATIGAGGSQVYTSTSYDHFNNVIANVTGSTTFTISPNGSCSANACTASFIGTHTVTGTSSGKTDTATLNVVQSGPASLAITPTKDTVTAGTSVTYTVTAKDSSGNSLGDVTASSTFTIAPDGSCSANACFATIAGSHTVTAHDGSLSITSALTVKAAALSMVVVVPADATITAGSSQTYTTQGFDVYGNSRGDLTSTSTFTISPNGSCSLNVCSASVAGDHSVTGRKGTKSGTAILHVMPGVQAAIHISPANATVAAGVAQTYTAQSVDALGNPLADVTASTTFTISPDGTCSANVCTATVAGIHAVSGTLGSLNDIATLNVNAGPLTSIVISPADASITPSGSQTYATEGFDAYGNSKGDFTNSTTFTVSPNGSCAGNVCTAAVVGDHTVRGLKGGAESFATLHVTGTGAVASIVITPSSTTVAAGHDQAYAAESFDQFGNPVGDVTASTIFTVAPDGSCTDNLCSATVAGVHTVTGTFGAFSDDAALSVNPAALTSIVISPADATITAGDSQAYAAEGFDAYGNDKGDFTSSTSFTISPNGSCTANVCTASTLGDHTVRGLKGGTESFATLHVVGAGAVASIALTPASDTKPAGSAAAFTANGFDQFGNPLGDVTGSTTFSISPDGTCSGNSCSATVPGAHTVTGTYGGSITATATLFVNAGPLTSIVISPADATVAAGDSQAYTAEGFDAYGNSKGDFTGSVTFTITPDGSCAANVCTANQVGDHTVKGKIGGATSTAVLHVTVGTGSVASITISPVSDTKPAGTATTYSATGFDQFGNSLGDVTGSTTFAIAPDGSCAANACSGTIVGSHTVTGTYGGSITGSATLNVVAGALTSIVVSPADATITAGDSQTYTAEGFDAFGNSKGDFTASTVFTITPNGSCTANVCTASALGDHTVRGVKGGASSTATLHVTAAAAPTSIVVTPDGASVAAGTSQGFTAKSYDQFGNLLGDVTSSTTFSISPDGSCTGSSCVTTVAGSHTVTGTFGSLSDGAALTVTAAGLDHIVMTPKDSTIATGASQTYTVEGFDIYGNSRGDLTSTSTFAIGPDGSCVANACSASIPGLHTVTATKGAAHDTAALHVGGATPTFGGFSPTSGNVGASVIITGTGFTGVSVVQFSGTSAAFTVNSDTQITATVPDGALKGMITVVAPGGTAVSSTDFKVQPLVSSFSPTSGPVGTVVTISGSAFSGATTVTFNSVLASFTVVDYHTITAVVPCCGASGSIKVTTPGGSGSKGGFKVPPTITSFSPGSGPVASSVVITGTAFTGATSVTINNVVATFTVDSDTQITVVVPAGATTGKIKVTTGGGSVSSSTSFTVS